MASGAVFVPPTTSTSGMMCGGLKGCPTRTRSGCLHFVCMTLGVIPDELEEFSVGDASEVSLSVEQCLLSRPIETGRIDRAGQVGEEHSAALEVERDADAFHQVGKQDVRGRARAPLGVHIQWGAVDRVAAR